MENICFSRLTGSFKVMTMKIAFVIDKPRVFITQASVIWYKCTTGCTLWWAVFTDRVQVVVFLLWLYYPLYEGGSKLNLSESTLPPSHPQALQWQAWGPNWLCVIPTSSPSPFSCLSSLLEDFLKFPHGALSSLKRLVYCTILYSSPRRGPIHRENRRIVFWFTEVYIQISDVSISVYRQERNLEGLYMTVISYHVNT